MKKYRVAFIGTGGRSVCYAATYEKNCDDVEIVALADPEENNRKIMRAKSEISGQPQEYGDWRVMLKEHHNLDGVVISTPNYLHAEQAVACLENGIPIALEKPLATTKKDCERIIDAERANKGRTLIGFVLRSTPFYMKIHELISTGKIGKVVSIQADELPGWGVSSIMNRSLWRRYQSTSGGAMLEKSCHDMDILNWMTDSRPVSLNSYGDRQIFNPNPLLPEHCEDCKLGATCQYYKKPTFSEYEDEGEEIMHQFIREDNRCIYNIDKDCVDVQSINIQYANGAVVNFMLNFNCSGPHAGRNFHAVGQKGRIWGCHQDHKIFHYDNFTGKVNEFNCDGDGSGHGGGDRLHALELRKMMENPAYSPEQDAYSGYLSAVICFAADQSRQESRRVNLRYGADNYVKII
jgi:predicted dehydrogenase